MSEGRVRGRSSSCRGRAGIQADITAVWVVVPVILFHSFAVWWCAVPGRASSGTRGRCSCCGSCSVSLLTSSSSLLLERLVQQTPNVLKELHALLHRVVGRQAFEICGAVHLRDGSSTGGTPAVLLERGLASEQVVANALAAKAVLAGQEIHGRLKEIAANGTAEGLLQLLQAAVQGIRGIEVGAFGPDSFIVNREWEIAHDGGYDRPTGTIAHLQNTVQNIQKILSGRAHAHTTASPWSPHEDGGNGDVVSHKARTPAHLDFKFIIAPWRELACTSTGSGSGAQYSTLYFIICAFIHTVLHGKVQVLTVVYSNTAGST